MGKRKDSYIGAKVQLLRDCTTRGGTTFRKGVKMTCFDSNKSGLSLRCTVRGNSHVIMGISRWDVTIVEPAPKKEKS